jgi:hypothetical protein
MNANAPVVLFVYNRPGHTARALAALRKTPACSEIDLLIFSDAPKNAADVPNVQEVRDIISSVSGFKSVEVFCSEKNSGLGNAVIGGVTHVFSRFPAAIFLEDDLEISPGFLPFMQHQLMKYQENGSIWAISGYSFFSHPWMPKTYALKVMSSWGWATWKDRWENVTWDASLLEHRLNQLKKARGFDFAGFSYRNLLKLQREGKIDSWAIRFYTSMYLKGGLCLFPGSSLVANNGFDGSGTHTSGKNLWFEPVVEQLSLQLPVSIPYQSRLLRYIVERHIMRKRRNLT